VPGPALIFQTLLQAQIRSMTIPAGSLEVWIWDTGHLRAQNSPRHAFLPWERCSRCSLLLMESAARVAGCQPHKEGIINRVTGQKGLQGTTDPSMMCHSPYVPGKPWTLSGFQSSQVHALVPLELMWGLNKAAHLIGLCLVSRCWEVQSISLLF
jgi:hypothetical protein